MLQVCSTEELKKQCIKNLINGNTEGKIKEEGEYEKVAIPFDIKEILQVFRGQNIFSSVF